MSCLNVMHVIPQDVINQPQAHKPKRLTNNTQLFIKLLSIYHQLEHYDLKSYFILQFCILI